MRKITILIMVVTMGLLSFFGIGCNKISGNPVSAVTPMEASGMLRNDFAVLVDVREADEVKGGMAQPAQWMPMSEIKEGNPRWVQFVEKLPKDKQIILYCAKGGRAGKVATMLVEKGFRTANMGGFSDWAKAGLPIKKTNN